MTKAFFERQTAWYALGFVLWAAILGGCTDRDKSKPKIRRMEGVAEKIDLQNNDVSMRVFDDKGNERVLAGAVREDTEVEINGRSQRLQDIRPGDRVVVYGYREGEGETAKLVATKVIVTRPEEKDWKSTGKTPPRTGDGEEAPSVGKADQPTGNVGGSEVQAGSPAATEAPLQPGQPASQPS